MNFKKAMLKRDRDAQVYGVSRDQRVADALSLRTVGMPTPTHRQDFNDGAFAVTSRQAWRGSGFQNHSQRCLGTYKMDVAYMPGSNIFKEVNNG